MGTVGYVLGGLTALALATGGYYLGRNPSILSKSGITLPEKRYHGQISVMGPNYALVHIVCDVMVERDPATGKFGSAYIGAGRNHRDLIKLPKNHIDHGNPDWLLLAANINALNPKNSSIPCRIVSQTDNPKLAIKP